MICLLFADSCRSVVSDLATDVIVHVGEVRFCLHKVSFLVFPVILLKLTLKIVFALEIMITGSRSRPYPLHCMLFFRYGMFNCRGFFAKPSTVGTLSPFMLHADCC
jgi:hypothetical protein